jgi:hypothetical protein
MSNNTSNLPPYDSYDPETYPLADLEPSIRDDPRDSAPEPYCVPIGYERAQRNANRRLQSTTSDTIAGPSSSQVKLRPSDTARRVDSVVHLPLATNDEDDIQDPLDSEPVPLNETRGWKIPLILCPNMTDEELERFWRAPYNDGNVPFSNGGPNVPSENSREGYDLVVREPDQLFDPNDNLAVWPASSLNAPFQYHPMGPLQRFLEAQSLLEEARQRQAERVREEERLQEEEDLQIARAQERLQRMDREELELRYKRPETREQRRYCADKHNEMLFERGLHVCEETPCFDNACTIGLPGRKGCRYAKGFHSTPSTSPCVWGWGLMLKEYEIEFGSAAAKFTHLDEVTEWYRQRNEHEHEHEHNRRFEGPVLVKDPPNPLPGQQFYWVVRPW